MIDASITGLCLARDLRNSFLIKVIIVVSHKLICNPDPIIAKIVSKVNKIGFA